MCVKFMKYLGLLYNLGLVYFVKYFLYWFWDIVLYGIRCWEVNCFFKLKLYIMYRGVML